MNNNQDNEIVVLIQDVIAGNAERRSFVTGYIRKCTLLRIQYIRMKKRA